MLGCVRNVHPTMKEFLMRFQTKRSSGCRIFGAGKESFPGRRHGARINSTKNMSASLFERVSGEEGGRAQRIGNLKFLLFPHCI